MKPDSTKQSLLPPFERQKQTASPWKWMAGSSAALGVASGVANAEIVQIVQVDNQVSVLGTNTLNADLTGDEVDDLMNLRVVTPPQQIEVRDAYSSIATRRLGLAAYSAFASQYFVRFGNTPSTSYSGVAASALDLMHLMRVKFTDARVNGGQETEGFVEVRARNLGSIDHQVILTRLIFDDESTSRPSATKGTPYPDATFPEPVATDPNAALRASLLKKLKREQRKLRRARQVGNSPKVQRIRKKIRRIRLQLRRL